MELAKFAIMCSAICEWSLFGYSIKSKNRFGMCMYFCFGILFSVISTFC